MRFTIFYSRQFCYRCSTIAVDFVTDARTRTKHRRQQDSTSLGTTKFEKPDIKYLECGIPEHLLRFKSTTYGRLLEEPFVRPNEHKVTLQVASRHLPLTDMERMVLKEIVGTRLNDETGVLQLSSVQFGSRIENKRHCVSMLNRIVDSAKSLAARVQAEAEGKAVET